MLLSLESPRAFPCTSQLITRTTVSLKSILKICNQHKNWKTSWSMMENMPITNSHYQINVFFWKRLLKSLKWQQKQILKANKMEIKKYWLHLLKKSLITYYWTNQMQINRIWPQSTCSAFLTAWLKHRKLVLDMDRIGQHSNHLWADRLLSLSKLVMWLS